MPWRRKRRGRRNEALSVPAGRPGAFAGAFRRRITCRRGRSHPDSGTAAAPTPCGKTAESKIEQKDFEAARPLLEKYLSQHPGDARALFDLGYVEDAGSHEDAAAADYRKAIAADPKQFEARLALGLLLAHQGKYERRGNRCSRRRC